MREWLTVLETNVDAAKRAEGLGDDVDANAVAFRLNALGMAANWQRQLLGDLSGVITLASRGVPSSTGVD